MLIDKMSARSLTLMIVGSVWSTRETSQESGLLHILLI